MTKKIIITVCHVVKAYFLFLSCSVLLGLPIVTFPLFAGIFEGREDWLSQWYPPIFLLFGLIWVFILWMKIFKREIYYLAENDSIAFLTVLYLMMVPIVGWGLEDSLGITWWHGIIIFTIIFTILFATTFAVAWTIVKKKRKAKIV